MTDPVLPSVMMRALDSLMLEAGVGDDDAHLAMTRRLAKLPVDALAAALVAMSHRAYIYGRRNLIGED